MSAYLDGTLSPPDKAAFEATLAQLPDAREQLERWRAVHATTQRLLSETRVPPQLLQRVRDQLDGLRAARRRRVIAFVAGVSGIAATILLTVSAARSERVQHWLGVAHPQPMAQLAAASFAGVFSHCTKPQSHAVEYAGESAAQLQDKFASQESFKVLVPDLKTAGFQIDGTCQCFNDPSVRVVAVHYHRANVAPQDVTFFSISRPFKIPNATAVASAHFQEPNYEKASIDRLSILTWDRHGGHFALCGETDADTLKSLANPIAMTEVQINPAALALICRP